MAGLEIAPWFAPIAPKAEGFNVKTLDFFPKSELYIRAIADPNIPDGAERNIEEVDFVGNATEIATLAGGLYDYVISSHNFEHLPDPVRFLQGVEKVLGSGGQLIMALPDCRYTFDRYQPHTLIGEWLEAYREERKEPTSQRIFEFFAYQSTNENNNLIGELIEPWKSWDRAEYVDVHCTLFFPASFELLMLEARALGLTDLEVVRLSPQMGEFFVWLAPAATALRNFQARREELLKKIKTGFSRKPSIFKRAAYLIANGN